MPVDPQEPARLAGGAALGLLVSGQALSFGAGTLTLVALALQTYRISHSSLVAGLLSLAELGLPR